MGVIESRRRILLSAPHVETTTPAGVANFTTDLISPLKSLKAGFLPVQSGTGDPSPSNVRPITGWSGVTVTKCGKNLFDKDNALVLNAYLSTTNIVTSSMSKCVCVRAKPNARYIVSKVLSQRFYVATCGDSVPAVGSAISNYNTYNTETSAVVNTGTGTRWIVIWLYASNVDTLTFAEILATVQVEEVASGVSTPTPYSPYTGTTIPVTFPAAGKNLFDGQYPDISGSGGRIIYRALPVQNGTYTMSSDCPLSSNNAANIFFLTGNVSEGASTDNNGVYSGTSRTVSTTDGYVTIAYRNSGGVNPEDYHTQLELGSTATSYEPYRNAFYGGYVDLVRGEVVATHYLARAKKTDFGDIQHGNAMDYRATPYKFYPKSESGTDWAKARAQQMFNIGKIANPWGETAYGNVIGIIVEQGATLGTFMRISETVYQAMGDDDYAEISYQLATPITYPLTPQVIKSLRGVNNIWSDAKGNMSVEYWKH